MPLKHRTFRIVPSNNAHGGDQGYEDQFSLETSDALPDCTSLLAAEVQLTAHLRNRPQDKAPYTVLRVRQNE